jgi:hypothetical protein
VRYTIEDARKYIPGVKVFYVEDACKPTSGCGHQGLVDIHESFISQQVGGRKERKGYERKGHTCGDHAK